MSAAALPAEPSSTGSARTFLAAALLASAAAALLAGWVPLRFSVVTVFLFAGPHNWLEFRYFLSRLPARLGRLRGFFLLALAGTLGLMAAFALLAWLGETNRLDADLAPSLFATWDTLLLL